MSFCYVLVQEQPRSVKRYLLESYRPALYKHFRREQSQL